tara:strand:- start:127846 stop:128130 length:285 start_codon:yes stop_codon:yes gene_type:complete
VPKLKVKEGHAVTIEHLNRQKAEKHGFSKAFLLGGTGVYKSGLCTLNLETPMAKALLGQSEGDTVEVTPGHGKPYRVKIVDVREPSDLELERTL